MRAALSGFVLVLLTASAPRAAAQIAASAPPTDYGQPQSWLCRPDRLGACEVNMTATVVARDGAASVEQSMLDPNAPVDCFYVYPTVSTDSTPLSDLVPDEAERTAVRLQLSRFGTKCRLFAPLYRQVTRAALRASLTSSGSMPDRLGLGYQDIRAAWRYYLAHDNNGRGVVLIGHSQGTTVLTELLRREIEGTPVEARIVSALLIGKSGGILVPPGRDVGGTFRHLKLCRSDTQFGCVVSYSAFRDTAPPPASALFARPEDATMVVACTNPAALAGGEAALSGYFDTEGRTVITQTPTQAWTLHGQPIGTPLIRVVGLLTARCTTNGNATYLAVTVHRGPNSPASRDMQGDLTPPWGLHLVDMELALGNLVELVGRQTTRYLEAQHPH